LEFLVIARIIFRIGKIISEAYPVPSFGDTPTRAGARVFGGVNFLVFNTSKKRLNLNIVEQKKSHHPFE